MKEKEHPSIEIHLPIRVEYPSTSRLGRIWQKIQSRMGLLQIRYPGMTPLGLLSLVDDKLSHSIDKPYKDSICQEREIKISKSRQLISEREEIIRFEVCLGKQSVSQATWHLEWLDAELVLVADGPLPLVYPAVAETFCRAYYLINNAS